MAHQYTCSACAFQVQSDSDQEIIDHVQQHAGEMHDMDVPSDDVRAGLQEVQTGAND